MPFHCEGAHHEPTEFCDQPNIGLVSRVFERWKIHFRSWALLLHQRVYFARPLVGALGCIWHGHRGNHRLGTGDQERVGCAVDRRDRRVGVQALRRRGAGKV